MKTTIDADTFKADLRYKLTEMFCDNEDVDKAMQKIEECLNAVNEITGHNHGDILVGILGGHVLEEVCGISVIEGLALILHKQRHDAQKAEKAGSDRAN